MSSTKRLPLEQRKSLNSSQDSLYIPHFTQGSIGDKPNNKESTQSLQRQSPTQPQLQQHLQSQPQLQSQQHQLPPKRPSLKQQPLLQSNLSKPKDTSSPTVPQLPVQDNLTTLNNLISTNTTNHLLQTELNQIKTNYETLMNSNQSLFNQELSSIQSTHQSQLNSLIKLHEEKVKLLTSELSRLKSESLLSLENEKSSITSLHLQSIEELKYKHQKALTQKDHQHQKNIESIQSQMKQQVDLSSISNQFNITQQQIHDLLIKIDNDKSTSIAFSNETLDKKEQYLHDKEKELIEKERNLCIEKELYLKRRKESEMESIERRKKIANEQMKVDKEIARLLQMQSEFKNMQIKSKEKEERDLIGLTYKESGIKMEKESYMKDYEFNLREFKQQRKAFEKEKEFFEKFKDDALKQIEIQNMNIDNNKKELLEYEKEYNDKSKQLQEKEFYIMQTIEMLKHKNAMLLNKEREKTEKENDVITAGKRIEEDILILEQRELEMMFQREQIEGLLRDIENKKVELNNQKMIAEENKTMINLRMKTIDELRKQYALTSTHLSNNNINK